MQPEKTRAAHAEELAQAIGLIVRRARATAPVELGEFSWTQIAVLGRLEREGPATSADLARAQGVTPQSMGTAVAVLEAAAMVERRAHPTDGRQMMVRLTAKGRTLREHSKAAKHSWLAQAMAKLDRQELATLLKASEIMRRMAGNP
jgi:DNA-binding MarR family transcriptional regulator